MKKRAGLFAQIVLVATVLIALLLAGVASAAESRAIEVSAAISLKNALDTLKEIYKRNHPNEEILFNYGASGMLQKQIEEGAPVDLFISAGKKQMDELASNGLIIPGTRLDLLGNEMVLIVAKEKKDSIRSFADLAEKAHSFSIGMPESVPAGKYAKETLLSLKLWDKLEKRIVYAKDVRQVLTYVDSGNVDAGLVYLSDADGLKSAVVTATAAKDSHSPIVYPMAALKSAKHQKGARKFMEFLQSPEAANIFAKYRFKPLTGGK
jgi:molybdate transport system substrate-binding protein